MHESLRKSFSIAASAALLVLSIGNASGQGASKASAKEPTFDDILSPTSFGGVKGKSFSPKNWLEIESELKIEMRPEPPSKTCEALEVKWYVAVQNPEKNGYLLLTKEVKHVNVPLNDQIFTSVYLSPASIRRLTGSDRGGKDAVFYVGLEVLIGGEVKGSATYKGAKEWWKTTSDKITPSETIPLLTKAETPFADMWWDRYAEVYSEKKP